MPIIASGLDARLIPEDRMWFDPLTVPTPKAVEPTKPPEGKTPEPGPAPTKAEKPKQTASKLIPITQIPSSLNVTSFRPLPLDSKPMLPKLVPPPTANDPSTDGVGGF